VPDKIQPAAIETLESGIPFSSVFDDVYFSKDEASKSNGINESRAVFIEQNQLHERFAKLYKGSPKSAFTIAETGFGTGLNFLLAAELFTRLHPEDHHQRLHFISVEKHPIPKTDLKSIVNQWPSLAFLADKLIQHYPPLVQGIHRLPISNNISLTLIFDDACKGFESLLALPDLAHTYKDRWVDAWFLDGFAPAKNPSMWTDDLFSVMEKLSHRQTTLATFTAAGFVNRGLRHQGFRTKKVKGYGRKREMIAGRYQGLPLAVNTKRIKASTPKKSAFWPIFHKPQIMSDEVTVVGAGIAGLCTAHKLSERGFKVTVIDSAKTILPRANQQAVLFPNFSDKKGPLADFHFSAFHYALSYYRTHHPNALNTPGLIQLFDDESKPQNIAAHFQDCLDADSQVTFLKPDEVKNLSGLATQQSALFYPDGSWINTKELFSTDLLTNVELLLDTHIEKIQFENNRWVLDTNAGKKETTTLILATSIAAEEQIASIDPNLFWKTGKIRGQVTHIPVDNLPKVKQIICHEGYICPSLSSSHYELGASYDLGSQEDTLSAESQVQNLKKLLNVLPDFNVPYTQAYETLAGKVGFRATTRDYLPLVGPIPKSHDFLTRYAPLKHNKNATIPEVGEYHPGLFVLTGFGSKGYTSAPLCAEILADYLTSDFFPLSTDKIQSLHPARFLIRAIVQNQPYTKPSS
jgi:tRNA 5-methylaminomethyl-2-thiouridine biosynthesis bifunctional protein